MFVNGTNNNETRIAKDVNMEIMIWMVGGILLLNIARLCLAIRQQKKS